MKAITKSHGSFGGVEYQTGEELVGDSDHIRSFLVNGLATASDEDARVFMTKTDQHEQYVRPALQALAAELDAAPPATEIVGSDDVKPVGGGQSE